MRTLIFILAAAYVALWVRAIARSRPAGSTGSTGSAGSSGSSAPLASWIRFQLLAFASLLVAFPFYWMITNSVKPFAEAGGYPPTFIPDMAREGRWRELFDQFAVNYRTSWESPPGAMTFARYFWVSFATGTATTVGVLLTSIPAAFALARMRFAGRGLVFYLVLGTLMVPSQVLVIPNYLILERLGWLDGYLALVVPFLASVVTIFLLRQFFMTVPEELWHAAQLDGAGRFAFMWRIMVPQAIPIIVATSIFTFLAQWNSLMWPLVVTTRPEMRTLMVGLQGFGQEAGGQTHLLMAAATFSMLPIVIAFFFLQRFFIQSVARTGLKG